MVMTSYFFFEDFLLLLFLAAAFFFAAIELTTFHAVRDLTVALIWHNALDCSSNWRSIVGKTRGRGL
jgi:hypothetical protein